MQGGAFGLDGSQKTYLYICQIVPTLIAIVETDLTISMMMVQIFYVLSSCAYIKFMSIQKSYNPYKFNEQLGKLKHQIHTGLTLGVSAFLLIVVYGIIFIKIGKVVLPTSVNLGNKFKHDIWIFVVLCFLNPILQEWFWRLFLPKTMQSTTYQTHITNISYLLFHFALFSQYVGFFRAVPLVGTFFSVGRSMSHIKNKYGIVSTVVTHYGISIGGFALYLYLKFTTNMFQ